MVKIIRLCKNPYCSKEFDYDWERPRQRFCCYLCQKAYNKKRKKDFAVLKPVIKEYWRRKNRTYNT